jgi:hypothetical protein
MNKHEKRTLRATLNNLQNIRAASGFEINKYQIRSCKKDCEFAPLE